METVRGWSRQSARRDFTDTIKVSEPVTHIKRFSRTDTPVNDFGLIADLPGDQFGCCAISHGSSATPQVVGVLKRQLTQARCPSAIACVRQRTVPWTGA